MASFDQPEEVLLTHGYSEVPAWLTDLDAGLRPGGFGVCWARSGNETMLRLQVRRLVAAVLVADRRRLDGLSILRNIRSVNVDLPCWLVTDEPTRSTLQMAFELRAAGVIALPLDPVGFSLAIRKAVTN